MSAALDMARRGLAAGEVPIGACLVQDGAVVATAHNAVGAGPDPTAHAEIVLIREACRRLRTTALGGAVLYVTVEPCPMCLAACHYAGVARVVYGAGIAELEAFTGRELKAGGDLAATVDRRGGLLAEECRELLRAWNLQRRPSHPAERG